MSSFTFALETEMRTVTYSAACSLDGFILAADGTIDWIQFGKGIQQILKEYWGTIDTVLMGRKTWEFAAGTSGEAATTADEAAEGKSAKKKRSSRNRPATTTYVFSRTLRGAPGGAELVSSDAREFVRDMKQQPGKGIFLMGSELAQSLFEADLVDEVCVGIQPVLLGAGTPLFRDPGKRIALDLVQSRTIDEGCVYATYRVRH